MSEPQHTPEPWPEPKYRDMAELWFGDGYYRIDLEKGRVVAEDEQDARRIVAAVNACRRMDTETLEHVAKEPEGLTGATWGSHLGMVKAIRERDEARAMLRKYIAYVRGCEGTHFLDHCLDAREMTEAGITASERDYLVAQAKALS